MPWSGPSAARSGRPERTHKPGLPARQPRWGGRARAGRGHPCPQRARSVPPTSADGSMTHLSPGRLSNSFGPIRFSFTPGSRSRRSNRVSPCKLRELRVSVLKTPGKQSATEHTEERGLRVRITCSLLSRLFIIRAGAVGQAGLSIAPDLSPAATFPSFKGDQMAKTAQKKPARKANA